MLKLNIIPQKLKKEIKSKNIHKSVKRLAFVLFILTSSYAIVLLITKAVLQSHFSDTASQTTLIAKSSEDYIKKVKNINEQIDQIDEIQNKNVAWSYFLEYMAKNIPNNISFSRIIANKNKDIISLDGHADTRDALLSLKKNLAADCFADIDFPIENLLKKENINFQIDLKLKNYEFDKL